MKLEDDIKIKDHENWNDPPEYVQPPWKSHKFVSAIHLLLSHSGMPCRCGTSGSMSWGCLVKRDLEWAIKWVEKDNQDNKDKEKQWDYLYAKQEDGRWKLAKDFRPYNKMITIYDGTKCSKCNGTGNKALGIMAFVKCECGAS